MKINRTNTTSRLLALLFIALMVLSLAVYGAEGGDKMDGTGSESKNVEEAAAMHKELMTQKNAILSENTALWEKAFMAADKDMTMQEDGKSYSDFLLSTIESAKGQLTTDELKPIQGEAEKTRDIKDKLTMIEKKYPAVAQESLDGNTNMSAGSDMTTPSDDGSMQKSPAFEGRDLDGNTVKNDKLFSGNVVIVVNFWFITCNPCVGKLAELDALNREFAEKDGEIIGISAFTLDGNEAAISEAKDALPKKGATYRNVHFPSGGEAGRSTTNVFTYPTIYMVDRSGDIVDGPIIGAVTGEAQAEALQAQTDKVLSADMG